MYYVGIDIGSTASKTAVRGEKELMFVLPTGCQELFSGEGVIIKKGKKVFHRAALK